MTTVSLCQSPRIIATKKAYKKALSLTAEGLVESGEYNCVIIEWAYKTDFAVFAEKIELSRVE